MDVLWNSRPYPADRFLVRSLAMCAALNPAQQKAVSTLSGPLLVLAGAGTGKTRVVTFRIAELIRHGTAPDRILAVTFTNKAASEMQERVGKLLGKRHKTRPQVSTFHAHCLQILRRHIRRLGYPERFAIYDRGDQESLARSVLREIRVGNETLRPGDLLYQISSWKSRCVRPADAATLAQTDKEHLAAMAFRRYQRALKNAGAVDFDDILLCTEELFENFADVLQDEAARSTICWSMNTRTPTAVSIASCGPWPPDTAICVSWVTTINRSMAGAVRKWSTFCVSHAIGPTPPSCGWK